MDRLLPSLDDTANATVRDALRTLAGRTADPHFRDLIDGVLTGRRSIRDVLHAPAIRTDLHAGVARLRTEWNDLTPAERERMIDEADPPP